MDTEASWFESSEMLATFIASTPLLSESWRMCSVATRNSPQSFVMEQVGEIVYVAFPAAQMVHVGSEPSCREMVRLDFASCSSALFPLCRPIDGEEPVMVHAALLSLFLSVFQSPSFQSQMPALTQKCKSVVITGHSVGGALASFSALYLLSRLQSLPSSPFHLICITFGAPLLGNRSLSRAIIRERWAANFCHVLSKHDVVPRLLISPPSLLAPHLQHLLHLCNLPNQHIAEIFCFVLAYLVQAGDGTSTSGFWPFGSYLFCSQMGALCLDTAESVIKMMQLTLMTASPTSCIEDHLNYEQYVGRVCSQFLTARSFVNGVNEPNYDAGVSLALDSAGIPNQEMIAGAARDCLKMARRMTRTSPNLNAGALAIRLSHHVPYRAEIEWYKACCDMSDDQMGYYDSFKLRQSSRREARVNMNRIKLANFWDRIIEMLQNNELPHDFTTREKWVNTSQFYKLLFEPLDIAEYYRTQQHRVKGHYIKHGRERRYEIFDRWWRNTHVDDEGNKQIRSRFASATQDSCFWARVEEARDWIDSVRSENDARKRGLLWENINEFEKYAEGLVERKEVSIDVLARNSSYSLWVEDFKVLKSQIQKFPPHHDHDFPSYLDGGIVP
ncbi:lipase-like PAD4 isoform X1 [Carica papaya]|uniref:lipase-like PAD4 isoform X1 n=2 Tax=Carica papaya TaxID=3649 RepID=UPI000B8C8EB1|nr:lipase-like PAD4 isoform X1 [Carica papaya]